MTADASGEQASKIASAMEGISSGQKPALERSPYEQEYTVFYKPKNSFIYCMLGFFGFHYPPVF